MPGSSFDDVVLVNPTGVRPAAAGTVAAAEAELGVGLPLGYAAYVERLGEGDLGHFVRVHTPAVLPARTREWRERVTEYWFWDTEEAGVAAAALQERGILLADSFDGDELCFEPGDPETLFVLPRDEDVARRVGPGFLAAVDWMVSGGLNPWTEGWTFEAWNGRAEVKRELPDLRLAEAVSAVTALGQHTHVVELDQRTTFFLPAIGGRLSIHESEGWPLRLELTHDEAADPGSVDLILAAVQQS